MVRNIRLVLVDTSTMNSPSGRYAAPNSRELVPGADPYIAGLVAKLRRTSGPLLRGENSANTPDQITWLRASYDNGSAGRWPLN